MDRDPIPQPLHAVVPALEGGDDLQAARCGRCRRVLEDQPALCARCEAILFPRRARSAAVLTLVPPLPDEGTA